MAMLKTLCRKSGGCTEIQDYIEKEGECLAYDYSESVIDRENWADEFDAVRKAYGKDEGRKYYHIIISPDPQDECDLATIRALATDWMRERHPDAQYVIGYHDGGGRIHAHIAMNSVLPGSGYKVHLNDDDIAEDASVLQRLCKERGLSYFEKPRPDKDSTGFSVVRGERMRPAVVMTDAERRIVARGMKSWKWEIRDAIDACLAKENVVTWDDFTRTMEKMGYGVNLGRRGIATYSHPDSQGTKRTVRGTADNLGSAYTMSGILRRMAKSGGRGYTGVYTAPERKHAVVPSTIEQAMEVRGRRRPWVSAQDVLDLMGVMRLNGYADARALVSALAQTREALNAERVRLAEISAQVEFFEQADARYRRLIELSEGEGSLHASFDTYIEEQSIMQWFDDHGTDLASYQDRASRERHAARESARTIAEACEKIEKELEALSSAARTAERIGMPLPERIQQTATRTRGGMDAFRRRLIASKDDLARLRDEQLEKTALRLERSGEDELRALAHMQREALLRKQMALAALQNGDSAGIEDGIRKPAGTARPGNIGQPPSETQEKAISRRRGEQQ